MADLTPASPPAAARAVPDDARAAAEALAATVAQAVAGDADAWTQLVHAYTPRLFALLKRRCGDAELAEELTQVAFVKLVRTFHDPDKAASYSERGKFEPYLFRIATNALRDEMRRRTRQADTMDTTPGAASADTASAFAAAEARLATDAAPAHDPANRMLAQERRADLGRCLAQLSDAEREVLEYRHAAGLSFAQIAETLDQPLGTVLARSHRAVKKLRAMMTETDPAAA
ncbi:MAG: RNA polymerase sigma factor [Planctomycetota bacterium]